MNTGAAKPNVRVHIRRGIVQIQCERSIIRPIVPIAAADGGKPYHRQAIAFAAASAFPSPYQIGKRSNLGIKIARRHRLCMICLFVKEPSRWFARPSAAAIGTMGRMMDRSH